MKIYVVDAFTDTMYQGNPAGVCLLDKMRSTDWMQKVAAEMNLSETAFIFKAENIYSLRWFTPVAEVDLCGHATLASAHILWEEQLSLEDTLRFQTLSGNITVERNKNKIHMNFPIEDAVKCDPPNVLVEGLGIAFEYVGRNRLDYLVEVKNEEIVRNLNPKFNILKNADARGIIVTSRSENMNYDFVSRCFYPGLGVNEDPVTGSAHCCLGPYWSKKVNKNRLHAKQLSKRQGILDLDLLENRIIISGMAVTTLKGELVIKE